MPKNESRSKKRRESNFWPVSLKLAVTSATWLLGSKQRRKSKLLDIPDRASLRSCRCRSNHSLRAPVGNAVNQGTPASCKRKKLPQNNTHHQKKQDASVRRWRLPARPFGQTMLKPWQAERSVQAKKEEKKKLNGVVKVRNY